ncbi:hypothetical protein HLH17_13905 [Acinetobacter sp. ANC 5380]|uniref:Uncharacterized protein n=1 Tax=Acinetobacter terrae TaxID=2731247 RepID=A0A7Y2WBX5_9GAMM|nr:hypothetical protein [Acinetobacter terrae]NNH78724.1 hypothetical protein [Acinetobacter terrae]
MSLSSILKSSWPKCKEFKEIVKTIAPQKLDFKTYSGVPAFSKYDVICENILSNSYDASLVGTAFDYLAKLICANHTNTKFRAEDFERSEINSFLAESKNKSILTLYKKTQDHLDFLLATPSDHFHIDQDLINEIILISKLENLWKSGVLSLARKKDILGPSDPTVYNDINALAKCFYDVLIRYNIIQPESLITYMPNYSRNVYIALGGIDADICIDGTLFDFKSTKNHGFMIKDSLQITSYYVFYLIDLIMSNPEKPKTNMRRHKIERIALYKSRFGQIEYFDVNNISERDLKYVITELNKILKLNIPEQRIQDFSID